MSLQPYTPPPSTPLAPVGNQVAAETRTATQASTRQAQQSVQLSQFTHQQMTAGLGVFSFDVDFPVTFTTEPVFSHGMTLPGFAATVAAQADVQTLRLAYQQAQTAYAQALTGPQRTAAAAAYAKAKQALDQASAVGSVPDNIPLASAFVKRWKVNDQNLYVGAEIIIVVRSFAAPVSTPDPEPVPSGSGSF